MLNDEKTEFLTIGTRKQLSKISIQSIKIGYFSATWLPKVVKQISAIKQGKLLLAELGRDFLEVESKGCMSGKRWEKGKGMSGNFNLFNSRKWQLQGC